MLPTTISMTVLINAVSAKVENVRRAESAFSVVGICLESETLMGYSYLGYKGVGGLIGIIVLLRT